MPLTTRPRVEAAGEQKKEREKNTTPDNDNSIDPGWQVKQSCAARPVNPVKSDSFFYPCRRLIERAPWK